MNEDSHWHKALNLMERVALRNAELLQPAQPEKVKQQKGDTSRRLQKWQSQSPFNQEKWFSRLLEELGIDEDGFIAILEGASEDKGSLSPNYGKSVRSHFCTINNDGAPLLGEFCITNQIKGFTLIALPLMGNFLLRLSTAIQKLIQTYPTAPIDQNTILNLLCSRLPHRIGGIVEKVGVLEMHVAKIQGMLEGETSKARFQSFVDRLRDPKVALALLEEYPVLSRLVLDALELWTESSIEFLSRLCADWDAVCLAFNCGNDPGMLEEIDPNVGDSHRRGRSVVLARFSSGFRVVYKPKSLTIDLCFAQLLQWLHERGAVLLKVPRVIDRGEYGWSEFMASEPCSSHEEITHFYERQGAMLALLYALEANDCHNENIIAVGEHPVLVDLECLFSADFGQGDPSLYRSAASFAMNESVLRVGLLPHPQQGKEERLVDRSGLGGQGGQLALRELQFWAKAGTDNMHLIRKPHRLPSAANIPVLAGQEANFVEFSNEILNGFKRMYQLLIDNRDELLDEGSILYSFSGVEVRVIFRLTQFYAMLLSESLHPDLLRNALDRDLLFHRLWFGLDQSPLAEKAIDLIPFELKDLWHGDVPFFSTTVDSLDVWASDGHCLPHFLRQSGLEAVQSRLNRLNSEDLERQIWLINGSLAACAIAREPQWTSYLISSQTRSVDSQDLVRHACAVGDRLIELAIKGPQGSSWIGLSLIGGRSWALLPFGLDLYGGLPGIVLFLAYLGWVTGNSDYTNTAEEVASSIREELGLGGMRSKLIGGFEGWGGLIHLWVHLATIWRRHDLLKDASQLAKSMTSLVAEDKSLDVVSGSAGGIAALLELYNISQEVEILELAKGMGDRIVSQAIPIGEGLGWCVPTNPSLPLTGFSHGASGVAWSLLNLYGATGNDVYKECALRALDFERSVFIPHAKNWPDLREVPNINVRNKFMTAWCHGSSGIGLSRLKMLQWLDACSIEADIEAALSSTLKTGFGSNHSLCHGDLGNLDFILLGSQVIGGSIWQGHLKRLMAQVVASIESNGWLCGVPLGIETPGLLCGLSGIGYELLRLAVPEKVPSVLLLDPPVEASRWRVERVGAS